MLVKEQKRHSDAGNKTGNVTRGGTLPDIPSPVPTISAYTKDAVYDVFDPCRLYHLLCKHVL